MWNIFQVWALDINFFCRKLLVEKSKLFGEKLPWCTSIPPFSLKVGAMDNQRNEVQLNKFCLEYKLRVLYAHNFQII